MPVILNGRSTAPEEVYFRLVHSFPYFYCRDTISLSFDFLNATNVPFFATFWAEFSRYLKEGYLLNIISQKT